MVVTRWRLINLSTQEVVAEGEGDGPRPNLEEGYCLDVTIRDDGLPQELTKQGNDLVRKLPIREKLEGSISEVLE